jgi:hypothetical protein
VATASSSEIPSAGGQSWRGRFRKIFRNDYGLRAGWRFLIYLVFFVVLIYSLATATEYFVKPGSGILAYGLFELMGLFGAVGAARIMSRIEKLRYQLYGGFSPVRLEGWPFR